MSHEVRLSLRARRDLTRLANFLAERDPRASQRMRTTLQQALGTLSLYPERTPLVNEVKRLRELRVRFGRYGYAIQYRVDAEAVVIAYIRHVREER